MIWDLVKTLRPFHQCHKGHVHPPSFMSRREFARTTVGAAAGALAFGMTPAQAQKKGEGTPVNIPGASPFPALGGNFHVFGPAAIDPIDAEPITITDFNGFVGLAYINGMVTETNKNTNVVRTLPMVDSDMRFMSGVYRGTDGRVHQGAFAFV